MHPRRNDSKDTCPLPSSRVHPSVTPRMSTAERTENTGFCGVEALLADAVAEGALPAALLRTEAAGDTDIYQRELILLDSGFCNRVHRMRLLRGSGGTVEVDVVVKEFSPLSTARSTPASLELDCACAAETHGCHVGCSGICRSPPLVFSSGRGVIHQFISGATELDEASLAGASCALLTATATTVAALHTSPLPTTAPGAGSEPMVWVSTSIMLERIQRPDHAGRARDWMVKIAASTKYDGIDVSVLHGG
eukprot:COSAG04_NODE_6455_length_1323_cov_1.049837_1_plen_250_part_01